MWTYSVHLGEMRDSGGRLLATGYSGAKGPWCNNPDAEKERAEGPIPEGKWSIGPAHFSDHTGPVTMNLEPLPGTETYGRSLFRIHGDNTTHNASHGCIILPRAAREAIADSNDHTLCVVR